LDLDLRCAADIKPASQKFAIAQTAFNMEHFFKDMKGLVHGGPCILHPEKKTCQPREPGWSPDHILVVGTPCPQFSCLNKKRFRSDRLSSFTEHEDFAPIRLFFDFLRCHQPLSAIYENVKALLAKHFLQTDNYETVDSLWDAILDIARREVPEYSVHWFVECGSRVSPTSRERVYAVFVHSSAGGLSTLASIVDTVSELMDADALKPVKLEQCFLPSESATVKRRIQERVRLKAKGESCVPSLCCPPVPLLPALRIKPCGRGRGLPCARSLLSIPLG
jgi:site-specific DNA-cytosine methylase